MTPPAQQAHVFVAMLLCGGVLGGVYDALWLARRCLRGKAACAMADLLFGVVCAAGVILTALRLRTDAFRWYTLAAVLAGLALYFLSLGLILRRIFAALAALWGKIVSKGRNLTK